MNPKRRGRRRDTDPAVDESAAVGPGANAGVPEPSSASAPAATADGGGPDAEASAPPSIDGAALQNRLAALQAEFERAAVDWRRREDGLLRQLAEADNRIKRQRRDRELDRALALGGLVEPLLAVLDDFERALEQAPEPAESSFAEGVALIADRLRDALGELGVKPIVAVGEKFDPNFHEAMMQVESDEQEKGRVVAEVQRGYLLDGRVLRPAKVTVAG